MCKWDVMQLKCVNLYTFPEQKHWIKPEFSKFLFHFVGILESAFLQREFRISIFITTTIFVKFLGTKCFIFLFILSLFIQEVPWDQNLFFDGDLAKIACHYKVTKMIQYKQKTLNNASLWSSRKKRQFVSHWMTAWFCV